MPIPVHFSYVMGEILTSSFCITDMYACIDYIYNNCLVSGNEEGRQRNRRINRRDVM
jgi:hypothetical protein